jgi:DNA-binding MarR family transcriptional regulator
MQDFTADIAGDWQRLFPELDLSTYEAAIRVLRLGRHVERAIDTTTTEHGFLVGGDYEVLASLRRAHPAPLQPASLAERTMITSSGMTGRLDRLEGDGLVVRVANPDDRRAVDIFLTEQGRKIVDRTFEDIARTISETLSNLEPGQISRLSRLVRSALASQEDELVGDGTQPG